MGANRFLLFGLIAAGVALLFGSSVASAAEPEEAEPEPEPEPVPVPRRPWPADNMPWMQFSNTTLLRQQEYNRQAAIDQFFGFPLIAEDGILGPESCQAFIEFAPHLGTWNHAVPIDCP